MDWSGEIDTFIEVLADAIAQDAKQSPMAPMRDSDAFFIPANLGDAGGMANVPAGHLRRTYQRYTRGLRKPDS